MRDKDMHFSSEDMWTDHGRTSILRYWWSSCALHVNTGTLTCISAYEQNPPLALPADQSLDSRTTFLVKRICMQSWRFGGGDANRADLLPDFTSPASYGSITSGLEEAKNMKRSSYNTLVLTLMYIFRSHFCGSDAFELELVMTQ